MDFNLSNEDIEKFVKDALIKSGIGESIKNSIERLLTKNIDNPLHKALDIYITTAASIILKEKFKEDIDRIIEDGIKSFIKERGFAYTIINCDIRYRRDDEVCKMSADEKKVSLVLVKEIPS